MNVLDFSSIAVPADALFTDAWGRTAPGAACPSQPAVQAAWIDAVAAQEQGPVELLGLGFSNHGGFFESICFCHACHYGYGASGGILEQLAREGAGEDHPAVRLMLMWRRNVQYGLLMQMKDAARVPLWLRTAAEPRFTGNESSLLFDEARGLVEAYTVTGDVSRYRTMLMPVPVYRVRDGSYERIHSANLTVL